MLKKERLGLKGRVFCVQESTVCAASEHYQPTNGLYKRGALCLRRGCTLSLSFFIDFVYRCILWSDYIILMEIKFAQGVRPRGGYICEKFKGLVDWISLVSFC